MQKKNILFSLIVAVTLGLGACSPMITNHGNMLKQAQLDEIKPETSTRMDVADKWGPPSTVSAFDPNIWYYIGETDSRKGIFPDKVEERKIIKVVFNGDDTVKDVSAVDPKLAENIEPSEDRTPTAGREFTAFQQFVGNLGKFNKSGSKKPAGP